MGIEFKYGDWIPPAPIGQTNAHLIASFPFMRDVQTIIRIATLLNDSATVKDYTTLYGQLVIDFNKNFYNGSIGYADGMQAANTLALALPGVVSDANKSAILAAVVDDINKRGHHTCGIVSIAQLFPILSTNGHHDLALTLAQQTSYPSYGWMFTNQVEDATTLWERWDSPLENSFSNSRNHIMYGSIGAWFYKYVAGIELNGLQKIIVRPRQSYDMTLMPHLHAEVVTVKGPVTVDYERRGDGSEIEMIVNVPANTNAVVVMEPLIKGGRCRMITESGIVVYQNNVSNRKRASEAKIEVEGISEVEVDANTGAVSVNVEGGGKYRFSAKWE